MGQRDGWMDGWASQVHLVSHKMRCSQILQPSTVNIAKYSIVCTFHNVNIMANILNCNEKTLNASIIINGIIVQKH